MALLAAVLVAIPAFALVPSTSVAPTAVPAPVLTASSPTTAAAAPDLPSLPTSRGNSTPTGAPFVVAEAYRPSAGVGLVGPLPSASRLDVVVGLSPTDASGLGAYVAGESVPGSSSYPSYLTPAEVGQHFGPAPSSVDAVRRYFSGYGLSSSWVPGGFLLDVQGASAAIGLAFGTSFNVYRDPSGQLFVSHPTAATLPAGLAVTGAFGLGDANSFRPFANSAGSISESPLPLASCAPGPSGGLSPCEIQTAYSFSSLIAGGTNGSRERIGIVDAYDGAEPQSRLASDLSLFAQQFGLPSGNVSYAYPVPTSRTDLNVSGLNTGWGLEEALDLEWARATAPGAAIDMAFSPDPGAGLLYAVNWLVATHAVDVISMSWGEPLSGVFNAYSQPCTFACNASTDGTYTVLDPVLEAAAAEGISLFAATGDCGAADGTSGLSVNYPAADPFVTAVGGTVLRTTSDGSYLGETGWNGSAPGSVAPGCTNQGGSGGGFSGLPRPTWQAGLPNASGGRAVPDVSVDGATPATVVFQGSFEGAFGTSLGTPIWAGIAAIADQSAGHPLGWLDPGLYSIYRGSNYSADFHDILLGNNGYSAGPGWDPVTGIGTPIVDSLLRDLAGPSVLPLDRPATFLYASPRYGRAPLTVSFAVNVTGGSGTFPVVGVTFGDGNSSLAGGTVHHEYPAPGVYLAQAFAVDSSGNSSASPPIAIVVGGGQALSVNLSASSLAPATGAPDTFTFGAGGGVAPYSFDLAFGDGTYLENQTGTTVVHAYDAPGSYCAEVVARDAASPVDGAASLRLAIAVGGAPAPSCGNDTTPLTLTPNPSPPVRDAPAEFPSLFASAGGAPAPSGVENSLQYWANDSYVQACQCDLFPSPGTYSVTAWENDTVGQGASARTNVTVAPPLVGDFRASTLSGPVPLTVDFSVAASGGYGANASATRWSFPDGSSSIGESVTHTFRTPGEYLVVGDLSDRGYGNTSEGFLLDVQSNLSTPTLGITATISPAIDLKSGTTVELTGATDAPPGSSGLALLWSLGNGVMALGDHVNETFFGPLSAAGPTSDTLFAGVSAVTSTLAVAARANLTLPSFFAIEAGGFLPHWSALSVNATLSPRTGPAPFTAFGRAEVEGPGTTAVGWVFGDGGLASGTVVNHTYGAGGLFAAYARAEDSFGDLAFASFAVFANVPLGLSGGPSVRTGTAPLHVTFSAVAFGGYGPPYSYHWTFSAGPPANGSVVNRSFSSVGTYTATVEVRAAAGAPLNRSWTVTVESSSGLPGAVVVAGAGAVGVAIGLVALWIGRRERRRPPPGAPTPSRPPAAGDGPPSG